MEIIKRTSNEEIANQIIKEWRPFPKQELFMSIPDSIKEAFYGGGAGSAKTETIIMLPIARGWYENERFKQVILRRTNPELKLEIIPRTKKVYPKFGATWNGTDLAWTFPTEDQYGAGGLRSNAGAVIKCGHCENEDDVHNYDGMEINCFSPDELTSLTEYIFLYIGYTRTRAPIGSGLPALIRAGGMPGDIGHTWVKKRLVDPAPKGGKIIVGRGGNKRIYIFANALDNPHLGPDYIRDLNSLPEAERKAKLGDWEAFQGSVFNEFRTRLYPDESDEFPNALHVIEPFAIPDWWPKMVIGDWGMRAMTYVGFFAISPTGRVYLYNEMHWIGWKIEEWAPYLKHELDNTGNLKTVKFCKSAGQDRGQEHTIQEQIETALGMPIELSTNTAGSRVAGKLLVHEYLRWKPKAVIPQSEMPVYNPGLEAWILRNKTPQDHKNYLALFEPQIVETNIPKLQIFPHCILMVNAIQACTYEKAGKDGKPPEDVAEFAGDDPYDTLRYACDSAERYFEESALEFETLKKQEQIIKTLADTNNWTAYYRSMEKVETNQKSMQVVGLIRRRRH